MTSKSSLSDSRPRKSAHLGAQGLDSLLTCIRCPRSLLSRPKHCVPRRTANRFPASGGSDCDPTADYGVLSTAAGGFVKATNWVGSPAQAHGDPPRLRLFTERMWKQFQRELQSLGLSPKPKRTRREQSQMAPPAPSAGSWSGAAEAKNMSAQERSFPLSFRIDTQTGGTPCALTYPSGKS